MSREAPPDSPAYTNVPLPASQPAVIWQALPLVALGLPVAYRLVVTGDLEDALVVRFVSKELQRFWYAATLVSHMATVG